VTTIVLLAAAPFEMEPSEQVLKRLDFEVHSVAVGIGALSAAKNAQKIAQLCINAHCVFIGTCGTFASFSTPSLITTRNIHWLPTGERSGLSYRVKDCDPKIKKKKKSLLDLPECDVICSPSISLSKELPSAFQSEKTVENLELYSIAKEIDDVAKTFSVILGVTNEIGKNAHQQWKENFNAAATMTAKYFEKNSSKLRSSLEFSH